jgi:hypothetical protein
MPEEAPVINVTQSVGDFRSDGEIVKAFGEDIVVRMAYMAGCGLVGYGRCSKERTWSWETAAVADRCCGCGGRSCRAWCVRPHLFSVRINLDSNLSDRLGSRDSNPYP